MIYLGPHATRNLDDVLYNEFGIDNGKGVLVVDSNQQVTVTSRVFTDGPQGGTSGNGVRTVPVSAMKSGTAVLPGVRMVDGFRTNVGFVTGDQGTTFTCKLYDIRRDPAGAGLRDRAGVVAQAAIGGADLRRQRLPGARPGGDDHGRECGADFLTYLTVIDGTSQDPVFVMPQ